MSSEDPAVKLFSENLERLLSGHEPVIVADVENDLRTALEFAQKMVSLRPLPSPAFEARLKEKLLQKIEAAEARRQARWYWIRSLLARQAWQAVAVAIVVLIFTGVLWITGMFNGWQTIIPFSGSRPPAIPAPTSPVPIFTAPATTTPVAPQTTAPAPTPTSGLIRLRVDAATDKTAYSPGEPVVLEVTLQNMGQQTLQIEKYPPTLSLMQAAAGQPVYTFGAGDGTATLAPDSRISYTLVWHQQDAAGNPVPPGGYYIELEDLDYRGQAVKLTLSSPVSFEILPGGVP